MDVGKSGSLKGKATALFFIGQAIPTAIAYLSFSRRCLPQYWEYWTANKSLDNTLFAMKTEVFLMKKKIAAALLLMVFVFASGASPAIAGTWEELATWVEQRETIRTEGAEFLAALRTEAPSGTERELWKMLWVGEARERAAAGVALMDRIFPEGNPARWEEARGFLAGSFYIPRQLAGMDAFYVTVAALDAVPGGEWTAAAYLSDFTRSGRGMVMFIEQMPSGLQGPIGSVIEKTGLSGDWTVKAVRRQLPLLPVYSGTVTRDGAESRVLQYLDGVGRLASNGNYAWDRDKGRIYQVIENSGHFWPFD